MRTVAFIQARTGSQRLPGKTMARIGDRALIAWTIGAVQAVRGVDEIVVATTTEADDDALVELVERVGVAVHRGAVNDVLSRCWDAVAPYGPDIVLRQTADNPFCDPVVAEDQLATLASRGLDYVGISGWPLGIAAEVCRAEVLATASREAVDPAEREHVMPFIYRRPDRFRVADVGWSPAGGAADRHARYTVDTPEDLELARRIAIELDHGPPVRLHELERIMAEHPDLTTLNKDVGQKAWTVIDERTSNIHSPDTGDD